MSQRQSITVLLAAIPVLFALASILKRPERPSKIPRPLERVLVLGSSSGVGRVIALQYAERGARVCVVGRRDSNVSGVVAECEALTSSGNRVLGFPGDFSNAEDMVKLRDLIRKEWNGIDTVVVCAGVSALQPIMALTGVESSTQDASVEGIQEAVRTSQLATQGNFIGPLVAAVTFIPMLQSTSESPSILLLSSVAAIIPAPTRALYAATKSSSLLLYQSLAIEHPSITFTFVLPATIEGDFRASAVDKGPVRELDPNKHGLKAADVARRCIRAVDYEERGNIIMPKFVYSLGQLLYNIWPRVIERMAMKKYNYPSQI